MLLVFQFHSGRVVNVSSVKGLLVLPFTAAYTMTKYAVEAFSDALRLEMNKFGVTVSIVEPGNFGGATESINVRLCATAVIAFCFCLFSCLSQVTLMPWLHVN